MESVTENHKQKGGFQIWTNKEDLPFLSDQIKNSKTCQRKTNRLKDIDSKTCQRKITALKF
jgi:hypothetical protein